MSMLGWPQRGLDEQAARSSTMTENLNAVIAFSCWIMSISMVAATVFFLLEAKTVSSHWKSSLTWPSWSLFDALRGWRDRMRL